MSTLRAVFALALAALVAAPVAARPRRPAGPPPACGLTIFPLAAGYSWTFRSGASEVVARVTSVRPGKDETEIDVEERFGKRTFKATWTCSKAGLRIAPESFFFAGEPGGAVATTYKVTERDAVSVPADTKQDLKWIEKVKVEVVRADAAQAGVEHRPVKLELEKHAIVHPPDPIVTPLGQFGATKITYELRGRAFDGDERVDLQPRRPGGIWLVKGVGPVKLEDAYEKTWELASTTVIR